MESKFYDKETHQLKSDEIISVLQKSVDDFKEGSWVVLCCNLDAIIDSIDDYSIAPLLEREAAEYAAAGPIAVCTRCGCTIPADFDGEFIRWNYCPDCGQKFKTGPIPLQ